MSLGLGLKVSPWGEHVSQSVLPETVCRGLHAWASRATNSPAGVQFIPLPWGSGIFREALGYWRPPQQPGRSDSVIHETWTLKAPLQGSSSSLQQNYTCELKPCFLCDCSYAYIVHFHHLFFRLRTFLKLHPLGLCCHLGLAFFQISLQIWCCKQVEFCAAFSVWKINVMIYISGVF